MYPVNTGPNQAITHLDATKLPWQVSTAALSDLDKNTSMANSQFVTTRMSMFSARVCPFAYALLGHGCGLGSRFVSNYHQIGCLASESFSWTAKLI